MTISLVPAPGSSSVGSRIAASAAFEFRLIMTNPEQFLLTIAIPVASLLGLRFSGIGVPSGVDRIAYAVPSVLALCVLATSFTALAIATGFERRSGSLAHVGTTPLSRLQLLGGKALAIVVVELVQFVIITGLGLILGWQSASLWQVPLLLILGTAAFSTLGLTLAGAVRAEATLAIANAVFLILLLGGGLVISPDRMPTGLASIVNVLPSGALADAFRTATITGSVAWGSCAILVGWTIAAGALAAKTFRWE